VENPGNSWEGWSFSFFYFSRFVSCGEAHLFFLVIPKKGFTEEILYAGRSLVRSLILFLYMYRGLDYVDKFIRINTDGEIKVSFRCLLPRGQITDSDQGSKTRNQSKIVIMENPISNLDLISPEKEVLHDMALIKLNPLQALENT
jgi:hypothetical protein